MKSVREELINDCKFLEDYCNYRAASLLMKGQPNLILFFKNNIFPYQYKNKLSKKYNFAVIKGLKLGNIYLFYLILSQPITPSNNLNLCSFVR